MADRVYLVCATRGYFADDVPGFCARCHAPIVHRPTVPDGAVKICGRCAAVQLLDDDDAQIRVTDETRREVALYRAKTSGTQ